MRISTCILFIVSIAFCVSAQTALVVPPEKSKPVVIPKFDKPPVIDGKLEEEVWQKAVVLKDFYQIQPGDNTSLSRCRTYPNNHQHALRMLYLTLHNFT